jgi:hypothetical protein
LAESVTVWDRTEFYQNRPMNLLWALSASFASFLLAAVNLLRAGRMDDRPLARQIGFAVSFGLPIREVFDFRPIANATVEHARHNTAATFSSKCSTFEVRGIGRATRDQDSSHAKATCDGLAFNCAARRVTGLFISFPRAATCRREPGDEAGPFLFAFRRLW